MTIPVLRQYALIASAVAFRSLFVCNAYAATVDFFVNQPSGTGAFTLAAQVSSFDNFGLASYSVPLLGSITTLDHNSPNTVFANSNSGSGPAGFALQRSPDGNRIVAASQDTLTPSPMLIRGFGQQSSSFGEKGIDAVAGAESGTWTSPLIIATGSATGRVSIDRDSPRLSATVFTGATGTSTMLAANFPSGAPPIVSDFDLGTVPRSSIVSRFLTADAVPPLGWSSFHLVSGPLAPVFAPTLSPTGRFRWDASRSVQGQYTFEATATNHYGSDVVTIKVNLVPGDEIPVNIWVDQPGGTGEFRVFAQTGADNFGLSGYTIPLTGPITSLDHISPNTQFANTPGFGPAGFTRVRSPDDVTNVTASQDLLGGTPNIIKGFGHEASSFVTKGITPVLPAEQAEWGVPLLIATGTATGPVAIDGADADFLVFAFTSASGLDHRSAMPIPSPPVPEPEAIALLSIATTFVLGLSRRHDQRHQAR